MACEERVFAVQGNRTDAIFDSVGVDLDAAIVQKGLQPIPVVGDVGELFAKARFAGDAGALFGEPNAKGFDQRFCAFLPDGTALIGGSAPDAGFDAVELGDAAQPFLGDG